MQTQPTTAPVTVLARICLKDPDFMVQVGSKSTIKAADAYLQYGEYLTVEFLSDGTARVVPVSELN